MEPNLEKTDIRRIFKGRKDCLLKKARELGILCDVPVSVVVTGINGEVETWPPEKSEVRAIMQSYHDYCKKKKDKQPQVSDDDLPTDNGDWVYIDGLSTKSKQEFIIKLKSQIAAIEKRLEFLIKPNEQNLAKRKAENQVNGNMPNKKIMSPDLNKIPVDPQDTRSLLEFLQESGYW